jgi:pantoate--beta-alanine ligase
MCFDLLLSHPEPHNSHIVPTARDPTDGLALSSRNAYLAPAERQVANTLYLALKTAQRCWEGDGLTKGESVARAKDLVERVRLHAAGVGVEMELEYLEVNWADSFEVVEDDEVGKGPERGPMILSGALWVGKTRLIDNVILGDSSSLGILP